MGGLEKILKIQKDKKDVFHHMGGLETDPATPCTVITGVPPHGWFRKRGLFKFLWDEMCSTTWVV